MSNKTIETFEHRARSMAASIWTGIDYVRTEHDGHGGLTVTFKAGEPPSEFLVLFAPLDQLEGERDRINLYRAWADELTAFADKHRPRVIKPAGQMILCEKLLPTMTRGGLHIPDTARDSADTAKVYRMRVVAIGPGIAHAPASAPVRRNDSERGTIVRLSCQEIVGADFDVGSVLLCSRYNYNCDVDAEPGKELRMVRAEDVLGVEATS